MFRDLGGWRFVAFCVGLGPLAGLLGGALFPDSRAAHVTFTLIACAGSGAAWGWANEKRRRR